MLKEQAFFERGPSDDQSIDLFVRRKKMLKGLVSFE